MTDHHADRRLHGIVTIATTLLEGLLGEWGEQADLHEEIGERAGGYLTVYNTAGERLLDPVPIGAINPDKVDKYVAFCQEKAERLATTMREQGHTSSRQSRAPDDGQWGGAVVLEGDDLIFSFSGLPELADEALMIRLGWEMPNIDYAWPKGMHVAGFNEPRVNNYLNSA